MNADRDTARWAAETTLGRRLYNHNVLVRGTELRGWEPLKATRAEPEPGVAEQVLLLRRAQREQGDADLRIDILEAADWRQAQLLLLRALEDCMNPDVPRATGALAQAADIAFAARGSEDRVGATFAARGNVMFRVTSLSAEAGTEVPGWTRKLDALLTQAPAQASPDGSAVKAQRGEAVELIADVASAAGPGWLKVIVPDGEVRREGQRLVYVADKAGSRRIERELKLP